MILGTVYVIIAMVIAGLFGASDTYDPKDGWHMIIVAVFSCFWPVTLCVLVTGAVAEFFHILFEG